MTETEQEGRSSQGAELGKPDAIWREHKGKVNSQELWGSSLTRKVTAGRGGGGGGAGGGAGRLPMALQSPEGGRQRAVCNQP